jgi:hypothetical protein
MDSIFVLPSRIDMKKLSKIIFCSNLITKIAPTHYNTATMREREVRRAG